MYNSTRSGDLLQTNASGAIIKGIADDGGLYVIDSIPQINIEDIISDDYLTLAVKILEKYLDDFNVNDIKRIVKEAYTNKFTTPNVVNLKYCSNCAFLELYHGPTLAFKDVALSILPKLLSQSKKINDLKANTIILTATSGDTGSAALSGFQDEADVKMIVFYPTQGISLVQRRQMESFKSNKAKVIAIDGNFDDAQNLVKKAFNDPLLKKYNLSSANSINIGRLIPQIVYYFYSYISLVKHGSVKLNDKINFVVPTGNFGNILAGYLAMKMGLPINKLICASNENKVLTDFFVNKQYDANREFLKTSSPSMDILISSNLERLLYYAYGANKVKEYMRKLKEEGKYSVGEALELDCFYAQYATEKATIDTIKNVYDKESYLIDTHTAVAYNVYQQYVGETGDKTYTVILSTAHPYKFATAISKALGVNDADEFKKMERLSDITGVSIPKVLDELKNEYPQTRWSIKDAYSNLEQLLKSMEEKSEEN